MHLLQTSIWPVTLGSGLGVAVLAVYVWTRRSAPGGYALCSILASIAYMLLTGVLEERSTTFADHLFWLHVQIPAYAVLPVCCLLLALSYTLRPMRGWRAAVLFVVPAAGVLLQWTNAWHHLYWTRIWPNGASRIPAVGRAYGT